jgi:antibiotic biosynthesis monooxygenase
MTAARTHDHSRRFALVPLIWAALVIGGLPALARAQAATPAQAAPAANPLGDLDLVGALSRVPGCLGVDVARTASGKQVIFAWFDDKAALLRWYSSDVHVQAMNRLAPNRPARVPLAGIDDNSGPILAIASITPRRPDSTDTQPFAQIAIELYRPLNGGIAVGGKFAPDALKVPGLREIALPSRAK